MQSLILPWFRKILGKIKSSTILEGKNELIAVMQNETSDITE